MGFHAVIVSVISYRKSRPSKVCFFVNKDADVIEPERS